MTRKQIVYLALITAICLTGDSMLYVALPLNWTSAGLSGLWQVGILLAINRIIRIPLGPLVGMLYGWLPHKTILILCLCLSGVITIGYGLADSFLHWIILRCLWGIVWILLRMGAYLSIAEMSAEQERGQQIGTYNGLYRIGSLLGMLAGGYLSDLYGLSFVSILFGALILVSAPFFIAKLSFVGFERHPVRRKKPAPWTDFYVIGTESRMIRLLLTGLLVTLVFEGILGATLSHMIHGFYSEKVNVFGITIGAATLAGGLQACRWTWGPWVSPLVGKKIDQSVQIRSRMFMITLMAAAIAIGTIQLKSNVHLWSAIVLLIFLAATILTTVMDSFALEYSARSSKYIVMTLYTVFVDIGAALGPLVGFLLDGPYYTSFFMIGCLLIVWCLWLAEKGTVRTSTNKVGL